MGGSYSSRKLICRCKPVSVEEITSINIPLSLTSLVEQLRKETTQHDYLIALLLTLLVESGFCIMYDLDTEEQCSVLQKPCRNKYSLKIMQTKVIDDFSEHDDIDNSLTTVSNIQCYKNIKFIHIPKNWKSITNEYKIYFALSKFKNIPVKLIAVPMSDEGFFNISTWVGEKGICSLDIRITNFVCRCPYQMCRCSDNLKIISYVLKDGVITPTQVYILSLMGLPNPSLQGLPIELQKKIIGILHAKDVISLAQCSRRFLQLCSESDQFQKLFRKKKQDTTEVTESDLFKWFTSQDRLTRSYDIFQKTRWENVGNYIDLY